MTACPIPPSDYAGTAYRPETPPATLAVPSALVPPPTAQLFGTVFPGSSASYLVAPAAARCQAEWFAGDGGEVVTAVSASDQSQGVMMVLRAGGLGPSTDLACPYIPAVRSADETFRGSDSTCGRPSGDVVQEIPSGAPNLYAAAVWIPPQVKDSHVGLALSGNGTDPTVALFTAQVTSPAAAFGQMIACTLASTDGGICGASLEFFLAAQSAVGTQIGVSKRLHMEAALSAFLDQHGVTDGCRPDQLRLTLDKTLPGLSQQAGAFFELHNISTTRCSLYGYPGFEAFGASGSVEPVDDSRGSSYQINDPGPHTVALSPGGSAYFGVGWGDYDVVRQTTQGCIDTARIASVPPNTFSPLYADAALRSICPEGGGLPRVTITAVAAKSAFTIASP